MEIGSAVRGLVKEGCRLVDTADSADVILALASTLHTALVVGAPYDVDRCITSAQALQGRESCWQKVQLYLNQLREAGQRLGPEDAAHVARACFFWQSFDQWAATLLTGAANWSGPEVPQRGRPRAQQHPSQATTASAVGATPSSRIRQLLVALLRIAPAPVVLQSLASHLSLVSPAGSGGGGAPVRSARVTAPGADVAAAVLAQRFAATDCAGVTELLLYIALLRSQPQGRNTAAAGAPSQTWAPARGCAATIGGNGGATYVSSGGGAGESGSGEGKPGWFPKRDEALLRHLLLLPPPSEAAGTLPHHGRRLEGLAAQCYDIESLAALLVSVPDRAAGLLSPMPPSALQGWDFRQDDADASGAPTTTPTTAAPTAAPALECSSAASAGDLPLSLVDPSLLRPEPFFWRLLQQLLAVLRDPRVCIADALDRRHRVRHAEGLNSDVTAAEAEATSAFVAASPAADRGRDVTWSAGLISDDGSSTLERDVTYTAVQLLAALLERLAKRGHAAVAADALLACTESLAAAFGGTCAAPNDVTSGCAPGKGSDAGRRLQDGCAAALLQVAEVSSAALERLLVALMDRAAAAAAALLSAGPIPPPQSSPSLAGGVEPQALQPSLEQHQRREVQFSLPTPHLPAPALATAVTALHWLLPPQVAQHAAVSYILTDRLLLSLQRPSLPYDSLQLLAAALPVLYPAVQPAAAAAALAAAWADADAVSRTSIQRQAYGSTALLLLLAQMDRTVVEATSGLLTSLLAGVSARLGSPLAASQRQAMRVGRAFSLLLDPASELFADMGDLGLVGEELWPGVLPRHITTWRPAPSTAAAPTSLPAGGPAAASTHAGTAEAQTLTHHHPDQQGTAGVAAAGTAAGQDDDVASVRTATDSDDDEAAAGGWRQGEEEEDDDDDLQPLGPVQELEGDGEAEAWSRLDPSSLQLRSLAAALRKQDEVNMVLGALKRLEVVIRAAPDELGLMAPELVRSLLHCRVPEWAEEEQRPGPTEADASPAVQRVRCLVALLTVAPLPAGDALLPEVYSPHLDIHQRLTLLDALAAAAGELSADPRVAPRLTQGPGARPMLQKPGLAAGRQPQPALTQADSKPRQALMAPGRERAYGTRGGDGGAAKSGPGAGSRDRRGRTRVWAPVALRKLKEQETASGGGSAVTAERRETFRNRFADVALRWAAGLLREVDRAKHGVDLLGRDHVVLGRLLTTLAAFTEAAAGSEAGTPLAAATLELIRAPQVHAHPEPYVRRAALLATGQVLAQLPPAAVAGALLGAAAGSGGSGPGGGSRAGARSGSGSGLAERLEWVAGWTRSTSEGDVDPHCRLMAQACVNLQADLASRCLMSLQEAANTAAPLEPLLPSVDLARTARLLTSAPGPSVSGSRGGSAAAGLGTGIASAATMLVTDVSAW